MSRKTTDLNGIQGVAAGNVATVQLVPDRRYHGLLFTYGSSAVAVPTLAQMENEISIIRIKGNSETLREFTPTELAEILAVKGYEYENGTIPIPFSEPWRQTKLEEEAFALPTAGIFNSLEVQIHLKPGVFVPTLRGKMIYDFANDRNRSFVKWERRTVPISGNFLDWVDIERVGALGTIHLLSADVTRVRVLKEGVEILDRLKAENRQLLIAEGFEAPASNFPVMFDFDGYADSVEPLFNRTANGTRVPINSLVVKVERSTAVGNFQAIIERVVEV